LSAAAMQALHEEQGDRGTAAGAETEAAGAEAEAAEEEAAAAPVPGTTAALETPARGRASGRRRTSSKATASGGAAGAAASAAEADGEEVSVPRSNGRRRGMAAATPRRGERMHTAHNMPVCKLLNCCSSCSTADHILLSALSPAHRSDSFVDCCCHQAV